MQDLLNGHTSRHVDVLPGGSPRVLLLNSLRLMRAGLSKQMAMQQALNVADCRPRTKYTAPEPRASDERSQL